MQALSFCVFIWLLEMKMKLKPLAVGGGGVITIIYSGQT